MKLKKGIIVVLTLILSLSVLPVTSKASDSHTSSNHNSISNSQLDDVNSSTRFVHSYTKTVTKTHTTYPTATYIDYKEYNMNAWFSGTLYLQSVTKSGNNWIAVYKGTLVGNI